MKILQESIKVKYPVLLISYFWLSHLAWLNQEIELSGSELPLLISFHEAMQLWLYQGKWTIMLEHFENIWSGLACLYLIYILLRLRFMTRLIAFDTMLYQILATGFAIILLNLGKRQSGDLRYMLPLYCFANICHSLGWQHSWLSLSSMQLFASFQELAIHYEIKIE